MVIAIMLMEIFIALLQAFIFAMLTSVFIGLVRHTH
jgi:F0F1-type ATP synthase membrane subunit a